MRKGIDFDTDGEGDRSKSKRKGDEAIWEGEFWEEEEIWERKIFGSLNINGGKRTRNGMILGFEIQTEMGWIHGPGLILPILFDPIQLKVKKKTPDQQSVR